MKTKKLEEAISRLFTLKHASSSLDNSFYYDSNLNKIFRIVYRPDNMEIPIYGIYNFASGTNRVLPESGDVLYMPLFYSSKIPVTYRTPGMLFYHLIEDDRIKRCISSKNEVYYGGTGIIMDAHKNPLILCAVKASKSADWHFKEFVMYINPIVFTSNGVLEKFIVSKVIPQISSEGTYYKDYSSFRCYRDFQLGKQYPRIIISKDINNFFVDSTDRNIRSDLHNCTEDFLRFIGNNEQSI